MMLHFCLLCIHPHWRLLLLALEDPEAGRIFFKWKAHRQIWIDKFRGYDGAETSDDVKHSDPKFVWPQLHSSQAQQSSQTGHWHLPIRWELFNSNFLYWSRHFRPEHNQNGLFLPRFWVCIKSDRPPPPPDHVDIVNRSQRNQKKLEIADMELF